MRIAVVSDIHGNLTEAVRVGTVWVH